MCRRELRRIVDDGVVDNVPGGSAEKVCLSGFSFVLVGIVEEGLAYSADRVSQPRNVVQMVKMVGMVEDGVQRRHDLE